jgi:hypothetical protein
MTNREKQFLLIILLLLFSNSILLFNYYKVSQKENNKKSLIWKSSTTDDFGRVLDDLGKTILITDVLKNKPYSLIIFFSLETCPACLMEKKYWNQFSLHDSLTVIAILKNRTKSPEVDMWLSNLEINFKVFYDPSGSYTNVIQKEFRMQDLPLKIFTNSRGEVFSYDGSHPNTQKQGAWYKSVKERIEKVFLK